MQRRQITIDDETADRLLALVNASYGTPLYPSVSEAIREAVARLHRYHFNPTSGAPDEVLERLRVQLAVVAGIVGAELERRGMAEDDRE